MRFTFQPIMETIDQVAKPQTAIAVLNGEFFNPKNEKTISSVTQNGKVDKIGQPVPRAIKSVIVVHE